MIGTPTASTLHCYQQDWRDWCEWCEPRDIDPLRGTVCDLTDCFRAWRAAGLTYNTIGRRRAAIGYYQRQAGVAHPAVNDYAMREVMAEIRRNTPPQRSKHSISRADLNRVLQNCDADPKRLGGLRDRAIFAAGWSCRLDRSELAALRVADLSSGHRLSDLSDDARRMVIEWLQAARIVEGPLFRSVSLVGVVGASPLSPNAIARVVKRRCAAIGKAKALFSASSMRNGRVAHEVQRGANIREIMRIARVRTIGSVERAVR